MPDYEKLYHRMFNAATDALRALDQGKAPAAKRILIAAQRQAEEDYINTEDPPLYILRKN